ncbi:phage holin, lambda family [Escherichia coli]
MKMHNAPHSWPDLLELLQSWWRGDTPLGAVVMSIVMAGLRIAYFGGGGGWKRKTLEILLCGALTLTFASALEYVGWTVIELQAAQQVGRPIDTQKYDGMQLKWQMDNDEQVYVGDSALNLKGLVTLDGVPVNNAAKTWATSTPDEIRASINQVLSDAWAASGYSVVPRDLLIPPEQFALLSSIIVSSAGNQSLLTYLQTNTISYHQNGVPLNIRAVKWLKGRGVGNKDRMVAYTNDKKYVRYPLVPLQSVPVQYRGLYQIVTYYGKLGAVEPVYKETISYVDGI